MSLSLYRQHKYTHPLSTTLFLWQKYDEWSLQYWLFTIEGIRAMMS